VFSRVFHGQEKEKTSLIFFCKVKKQFLPLH